MHYFLALRHRRDWPYRVIAESHERPCYTLRFLLVIPSLMTAHIGLELPAREPPLLAARHSQSALEQLNAETEGGGFLA
jgi:hypothetical protein